MKFFEQQCLEDSDFTPGAYFFEVMPLPRNDREADLLLRKFEEDASRWGQYEYDDDDEDEDDEVPYTNQNLYLHQFYQKSSNERPGLDLEQLPRADSNSRKPSTANSRWPQFER